MEEMKYNILWADDEIVSLCDDNVKVLFQRNNIELINTFENAESLKTFVDATNKRIDVIVVDANFPYKEFTSNKEKDTLGLQKIAQWIERYESKFACIVYTGRRNLVDTEEGKMQFEYFIKNDLIVNKDPVSGIKNLIAKIKELVDRRSSTAWIIENKYRMPLLYAEKLDKIANSKSKSLLLEILIDSYENKLTDTENYFNRVRCEILEKMKYVAENYCIIPEGLSLNNFSLFMCKDKKLPYKYQYEDVLPKALYEVMRYVVRMTQSGSHGGSELNKNVRQYIVETKDILLIQSVCFGAMELLEWFMKYLTSNSDKINNALKWSIKESDKNETK